MTAAPSGWLTAETLDKWEDWTRDKLRTAKRRDVASLENDLILIVMAKAALAHQAALETATRDKEQLQAALQALVDAEDNGANLDRYMDESGEIDELWQNAEAALAAAKGQAPCDVSEEAEALLKGNADESV